MNIEISVTVNGEERHHLVEPRLLLVQYLRDILRLTGTHVGCDTSSCGSCTIIMNGKATKSCTLFAVQASGAEITTIEGIAGKDGLHPLQQGFNECHGLQCGFCTPGMIVMAKALLDDNPAPSEEEVRHHIRGNTCRCTGYTQIVKAVQACSTKAG